MKNWKYCWIRLNRVYKTSSHWSEQSTNPIRVFSSEYILAFVIVSAPDLSHQQWCSNRAYSLKVRHDKIHLWDSSLTQ